MGFQHLLKRDIWPTCLRIVYEFRNPCRFHYLRIVIHSVYQVNDLKGSGNRIMNLQFEYFYGSEAEQFAFYRIPKSLMTDGFDIEYKNEEVVMVKRNL